MLQKAIHSEVASVDQRFSGPISGNALLMLDQNAAVALSQMLTDGAGKSTVLDSNGRETITEVGNILLNACLGVFGNLLQVQVNFAVPRLQVDTVSEVMHEVGAQSKEKLDYGLMIHTRFFVKMGNVMGYLVIILGITSLDRLLLELGNWEKRQAT
jgi:chemotaxis protein CheC